MSIKPEKSYIVKSFEKSYIIPDDTDFNFKFQCYRYRDYPNTTHPINNLWEAFIDGYYCGVANRHK